MIIDITKNEICPACKLSWGMHNFDKLWDCFFRVKPVVSSIEYMPQGYAVEIRLPGMPESHTKGASDPKTRHRNLPPAVELAFKLAVEKANIYPNGFVGVSGSAVTHILDEVLRGFNNHTILHPYLEEIK